MGSRRHMVEEITTVNRRLLARSLDPLIKRQRKWPAGVHDWLTSMLWMAMFRVEINHLMCTDLVTNHLLGRSA